MKIAFRCKDKLFTEVTHIFRFANSGKFMPAGLVLALSLAMVARYGLRMAGLTRV